jgi:hypothetical protein
MNSKFCLVLGFVTVLWSIILFPSQGWADLLGPGKTVQAFYIDGSFASIEPEVAESTGRSNPAPLTAPVTFQQGAVDGAIINVDATTITITNDVSAFFCTAGGAGTACTDAISGFDFKFTGELILGVSVDPVSAADMLPVSGTFPRQRSPGPATAQQ